MIRPARYLHAGVVLLLLFLLLPGTTLAQVPNDECVDRIDIFDGDTPFSTVDATGAGPLITLQDMGEFEYNIQRLVHYEGFDGYLSHLEKWRKGHGLLRAPYASLRWYINGNRNRLEQRYERAVESGLNTRALPSRWRH